MGLIERLRPEPPAKRFSLDQLIEQINFLGNNYPIGLQQTMTTGDKEEPDTSFVALTQNAYRSSGPVFSCILARAMLFSEARFQWQRLDNGRPGALFGNRDLRLLEEPWPNGTTGEMLWRAEQDVSLAGNFFLRLHRDRLWRLRPDWMTIVLGSRMDVENPAMAIDAEVVGYIWNPPGSQRGVTLFPEEIAHWSPIPDPIANYRGMSWLTPITREIEADHGATTHKGQFFKSAATPNLVVMPDSTVTYEEFKDFREDFAEQHEGAWNAYKTLFLGGGSTVETVGLDFEAMDFRRVQGAGETRIASAAGVPPIIAGFSEGLAAATYANYGQARRKFGDHFARPEWRSFSAAVAHLVRRPEAARLWYDDRDIAFLREDQGDEAEIRGKDATTIRALVEAGFDPDAAVAYVESGNVAALTGQHTGLMSVQLLPPDAGGTSNGDTGNGDGDGGDSGNDERNSGLDDVDGIDPLEAASLLQKLYLATPNKQVVSTDEARRLARRAGMDLDEALPDELTATSGDVGGGFLGSGDVEEPDDGATDAGNEA